RASRSCIKWPWASIAAAGSNGLPSPYELAVPGMNCAIPCAPAPDTANGLKFDSAYSCAASRAAEMFQRWAACDSSAAYCGGTNDCSVLEESRDRAGPPKPTERDPGLRP